MSANKDAGHAFARPDTAVDSKSVFFHPGDEGMSLLAYFAGQALIGIILRSRSGVNARDVKDAWNIAAQMMEQRKIYEMQHVTATEEK